MKLLKILKWLVILIVAILAATAGLIHYLYRPVTKGTLYLENAKGTAEILREVKTSIPHVYASSEQMAVYSQGFLHAQERLWQMERLRRLSQGRLSEIIGEKTLGIDKFFRTIGLHKSALESLQNMAPDQLQVLQTYSDGVNDFINNIHLTRPDASAHLLPPEFYALGLTKMDPWSPVDSISILKLLNLHLSWNWMQDLMREVLDLSGLKDMTDEIFPYTAEFSHKMVTIINPEDIIGTKFWSEETLTERHYQARGMKYIKKLSKAELEKAEQEEIRAKLELEELAKAKKLKAEQQAAADEQKKADEKKKKEEKVEQKPKEEKPKQEQVPKKQEKVEQAKPQEPVKQTVPEPVQKQESVQKQEPVKKLEEVEQVKEPEQIKKAEKTQEPAPSKQTGTVKQEEPVKVQEPEMPKTESTTKQSEVKQAAQEKVAEPEKEKTKEEVKKEPVKKTVKKVKEVTPEVKQENKKTDEGIDQFVHLDDNMASNNWVIHGNYTKTGKPLLASDPHLGNQLPSHWYLMQLSYDGIYCIGASHPGLPFFTFGKTNHLTWGITAALTDLSDLFRETLSEDNSRYYVDGGWRDLKVRTEFIPIKGQEPMKFEVKSTHRGPLLDRDLMGSAEVLFAEGIPTLKEQGVYSFAWSGAIGQENTVAFMKDVLYSKNIKDLLDAVDKEDIYGSVPQNVILAYENGDIGYLLGSNIPIRKHNKPFTGCKVLDGTTSENDWIGFMKPRDLPRVVNPKQGYIITANNRQVPDNFISDTGATITSTTRAQRINEMISQSIEKGHKFDYQDMIDIQDDTVDIVARDMLPIISKMVATIMNEIPSDERKDVEIVLNLLRFWRGDMSESSIEATVYSAWQYFFYKRLFIDFIDDEVMRLSVTANYPFIDYFQRMVQQLENDQGNEKYNRICNHGYSEYTGKNQCVYSMARSMAEAYRFLASSYSKDVSNWKWGSVHVNDYPSMPFSMTPLKPLFHRESPTGGNGNTVKVSKYSLKKFDTTKIFRSTHTPNYKQVVQYSDKPSENKMFFSIDGGQNGNFLAGHYFDFNRNHLDGKLVEAYFAKAALDQVDVNTLVLEATSTLKKSKSKQPRKNNENQDNNDL